MGWSDCGLDEKGRSIGYAHEAVCDHKGCKTRIHRGLAYACAGMHGQGEWGCDQYFCEDHLELVVTPDGDAIRICNNCASELEINDELEITGRKDDY